MKPDNQKYTVIGVMSGTSLDGIDLVLCSFIKKDNWHYIIHKCKTIKYSNYWIKTLKNLHKKENEEIDRVSVEYGIYIGNIIKNINYKKKIDLIASHGHTIFHQPEIKYTLQIGSGKHIFNTTKIKTITNFRNKDISLGGQGAPLVPIGDIHLFSNFKYCLNLGGFANISLKKNKKIFAFDICPVNIILNYLSQKIGFDFDQSGNIAKSGKVIDSMLLDLNKIKFYEKKYPKSLSREWVEHYIYPIINNEDCKIKDILCTFCEHIALQISKHLHDNEVLITGGGTFNTYLLSRIKFYSKSKLIIPNHKLINFKEALIFGFLGVLKLRNEINCLNSVTGAKHDSSGGEIFGI